MLTAKGAMMLRMGAVAAVITAGVTFTQGEVAHRVEAVLMNRESSLHTSMGNRDVYLLRVTPRSGAAFDAIAVDSYPEYAEGLPLRRLTKDVTFSVKLARTPYCDRVVMGDEQAPPVRCFTIDHGSLKMPKNAATDLWWK